MNMQFRKSLAPLAVSLGLTFAAGNNRARAKDSACIPTMRLL